MVFPQRDIEWIKICRSEKESR